LIDIWSLIQLLFLLKKSFLGRNFGFNQNRFLVKFSFFGCGFLVRIAYLTEILIVGQNFDFSQHFDIWLFVKNSIFGQNYESLPEIKVDGAQLARKLGRIMCHTL